ncbi:MAG: biotin/lipoyl-containing protein [Candidatus Kapaibacterium sp.]
MKKFKFKISGNEYEVEVQKVEDGIAKIEVNGTNYEVNIEVEQKVSKTPTLVRARTAPSKVGAGTSKPSEKKGTGFVKAPLPGTILTVKVKEGQEVKSGDVLLIMEAMKMENEIKADQDGVIQSVKVQPEQTVLEGDVLVEIGS